MLNALERLAAGNGEQIERTRRDLALSESQLRDFGERIGKKFELESYVAELEALRDALKVKLATADSSKEEASLSPAQISQQIKETMSAHQVEAAPQRMHLLRAARGERPVTARLKRDEVSPESPNQGAPEELQRPAIVLEPAEAPFSLRQEAPSLGFSFEDQVAAKRRTERKQRELF
jgi:hypothetical protein